ncbi:MAG: hypothetical protein AAFQ94_09145 [Bacteroidota bacterium]
MEENQEQPIEDLPEKKGKSYPDDLKKGQTLSIRLDDADVTNLTKVWRIKKFKDVRSALSFCIREARKRNCW